jgi:hypothetical protein
MVILPQDKLSFQKEAQTKNAHEIVSVFDIVML